MVRIPNLRSGLVTDFYELTMASSYFSKGMSSPATFSLFNRNIPENRGYFVNAGLDDVLDYLENLRFADTEIDYLRNTGMFSEDFLHFLAGVRFTGDVWAMKEGEIFFANEPVIEINAPIIEAQIVETFVVNTVHLQSLICTKASRCVKAAEGRSLIDFSLRRTHGVDAGLKVARSSYIAGFTATSNVLAGQLHGIPISGTMAHSYITAFEDEMDAFRAFSLTHPNNTILLIDTYDTLSGARKACEIGREMKGQGRKLWGVRLDSGDMAELSTKVRQILDEAGLEDTMVFASGGFDEYKISEALSRGANIDGFGVGTSMGVSQDVPSTDMAYKMVEYGGRPVVKLSTDKETLPAEKQVFRTHDKYGCFKDDTIALRKEKAISGASPLLVKVMEKGRRIFRETLEDMRKRCAFSLNNLPDEIKRITDPGKYTPQVSGRLKKSMKTTRNRAKAQIRKR